MLLETAEQETFDGIEIEVVHQKQVLVRRYVDAVSVVVIIRRDIVFEILNFYDHVLLLFCEADVEQLFRILIVMSEDVPGQNLGLSLWRRLCHENKGFVQSLI